MMPLRCSSPQYSDIVTDLNSEKALLLINRRLAQAEEHNRQLSMQLKAKSEQLRDLEKLNSQLQNLLEVKVEVPDQLSLLLSLSLSLSLSRSLSLSLSPSLSSHLSAPIEIYTELCVE